MGLTPAALTGLPAVQQEKIRAAIAVDILPDGHPADVIESVSEGVVFNSLEEILHTHINRLVVLRPRISPDQIVQQLVATFQLVGNAYDFSFDCADGSLVCCTEVIYYALHGRGYIRFPLTRRMGAQTLSADDIVCYYLKENPRAFEFVMYIEEAPDSPTHAAAIYTGEAGKVLLAKLMAQAK